MRKFYRPGVKSSMRHRVDGRLFGRTANQRKALLRGIVESLFDHQRIETTVAKAKEAKRIAERMITFETRNRMKDSAPMAVLEFIDYESIKKPKGKAKKAVKESNRAEKSEKAEKKEPKKSAKAKKTEKAEKKGAEKPAETGKSKKKEKE
jgi:large subunit ribosomal protein L17